MEILQKFVKDAVEYFYSNVMEKKKEDNNLMCWVWDEYWEDAYKRKKRPIKSISLNGNEMKILEDMKLFLSDEMEEKYNLLGIPYKKNYLFEGYPGTGKTSLIYSLASELDLDISILNFNREFDDVTFMKAVQRIPENSILVLEDIDVLFQERKSSDQHKHAITFSGLLNVLDGLGHQDKLITIMTTNYANRLDKALIRPGRIDYVHHFDYSTKAQLKHMFLRFFPNNEEAFKELHKLIKDARMKLTTAMFQQFLILNMNISEDVKITDKFEDLEEIVKNNDYSEEKGLYN